MSYTKGKWFLVESDHSVCVVKNGEELEVCNISSIDEGGIKRFHRGEESQANANLICAAPKLLEALELIKEKLGAIYDMTLSGEDIAKIDAAIALARG